MAIKVAINGFGRIGRLAYRLMHESNEFEVVAINDLTDAATLAHLLAYDSAQGRFIPEKISSKDDTIIVENNNIKIYAEKDPENLPWKELNVDLVLECTGFFTSDEKAGKHLKAGAKKVLISAPATGDVKNIVFSVNDSVLTADDKIVSGASCTTNCLAPMANVLHNEYKIESGFMTTIHAYTNDQNTLDAPHSKDLRRARAAAANIVPNTTGAAKAIGLVIPELKGVLDGSAQRVPVITGSLTELVSIVNKETSVEEVNAAMKAAANESYGYTEVPLVSSDIIGIHYGSLFDATQTKVTNLGKGKSLVKTVAWYDNEMSYTAQLIRTAKHIVNL
ncbi:MAG: type I glyceraldehyde-3-phosphate dehydrogenase [Bacilli bacterium]